MSIQNLRLYIEELREWLVQHAPIFTEPEQARLFAHWSEELTAAERLLEEKPELPIAFLGPSQQGKSSLINAILGENILAVGGAVGACTCVITSVHYRPAREYKAEIGFISLEDWRAELMAIREAIASPSSSEDTELDRSELEADRNAALEKFEAVYRTNTLADLGKLLEDPNLGLPVGIARVMSEGNPIILEEGSIKTFHDKVRRCLVGRTQHPDGQYWPLISRVRIFGNFEALANGVVLVDLPGLNDPNPAREQVTKRYLEEARYIWLVCNSGIGIDKVMTQTLQDDGLLFRLFVEGRLDAFSVISTRADDMNLAVVLGQMGVDPQDFNGDFSAPLEFRRREIASQVQTHLLKIAQDIATRAEAEEEQEAFLERLRTIPVFSVSTAAYLHEIGRMPLYQGMKLEREDTHIPRLIDHLHSITLGNSYQMHLEASSRRLHLLYDQVRSFFSDLIRRIEQDSAEARQEWSSLCQLSAGAAEQSQKGLRLIQLRSEESLKQRCDAFDQRLIELSEKAANALQEALTSWGNMNWRCLEAAVKRRGEWHSRSANRDFNLNRDIAQAYLNLLPFVWDEFFGSHLSSLVEDTSQRTQVEIQKMSSTLIVGMGNLHHRQNGIRESIEASLNTAEESLQLQSEQVVAELIAQIQRTRQSLSNGLVETASNFMQIAYENAGKVQPGQGIKKRILEVLIKHATQQAPTLFINIRQELSEGVATLKASMKPQLSRIVGNGKRIVNQLQQNMTNHQVLTPEQRNDLQDALSELPEPEINNVFNDEISQETHRIHSGVRRQKQGGRERDLEL